MKRNFFRRRSLIVWIIPIGALAVLLAISFGVNVMPAFAHGGAELTVSPLTITPGGTITIQGEGVESGENFTITLEGLSYQSTLGTVIVGDDEDFHQDFIVPVDVLPGIYQVKATSAEGETIATELIIEAGIDSATPVPTTEPSADPMELDRRKSGGELAAIITALVVSAGFGFVLVRARK